MLKTVVYDGPFDAVDVPLPSGLVATVKRGASCDFPAAIADALLAQTGWSAPAPARKPKDETPARDAGEEVTTDAGR